MASFGQRIGKRPVRAIIQTDSIDDDTRVALWNDMHAVLRALTDSGQPRRVQLMRELWGRVLRRPADEYAWTTCELELKENVLERGWIDALETVEGFGLSLASFFTEKLAQQFRATVNGTLASGLVGYRFVGNLLVAVDDDQSAAEIMAALSAGTDVARSHLERATMLLADRQNPQYGKVAGEAVLAVEASVYALTGKKTLGSGVAELGKRGLPVHPAIVKAWSAMYGYTSDAGGIRHANIGGEDVDSALAVYLLVTCSAFVNLLTKVAANAQS